MTGRRTRGALIIGGGGGLGRRIAGQLGGEGWIVGLIGRESERLEEARRELGEAGVTLAGVWSADACDAEGIGWAVEEFVARGGSLDAMVYAAGSLRAIGPLEAVDLDEAWKDVETGLRGLATAARATLPALRRSGSGVIIALIGPGYNGELAHAALYSAVQAGLGRMVESLGKELEPSGVVVYGVYPGLTPTPFMHRLLEGAEGRRWLPRFTEAFAEGKEVGPELGAEMVAWLATERPAVLSGRVIPALQTPGLLEGRLDRYAGDMDQGRLRLR